MSRLWAITSYFNPVGYRTKPRNYRIFRSRLQAPLLAVEWSPHGVFELGPGDAEIVVSVAGGDLMWQKERLLNLALERLPHECDMVAWLDCDILFERDDWAAAAERELERRDLCQLYRTVFLLDQDARLDGADRDRLRAQSSAGFGSMGHAAARGLSTPVFPTPEAPDPTARLKRGHAWAARRDAVQRHGLYDRHIIGGGDRAMAHAATGQPEDLVEDLKLTPEHAADYRQWARAFRRDVSRIGYVDGDLYHLWHGDLARRGYRKRFQVLRAHQYDPWADLAVDDGGCWRWASRKPGLHREIAEYFEARAEDGAEPCVPMPFR